MGIPHSRKHVGRFRSTALRRDEDADVGRLHAARVPARSDHRGVEHGADARGDVGNDEGGGSTGLHALRRVGYSRVIGYDAQVDRHLAEGIVRGGRAGVDAGELDVGVTEPSAVEQQAEGVEELSIGAMVGAQRCPLGAAHGVEVGVHVGAAEPEDRLFRISDGDQSVAGEGTVEDLPLQPIGVLEFVDEDEPIAGGQLGGELRTLARLGKRSCEVADESVVADLPADSLASLDLGNCLGDARRPSTCQSADRRIGSAARPSIREHGAYGGDEMPLDLARRQRTSGVHGVGTERPVVGGPAVPIGGQGQRGVGQAGEQEVAHNLGDELGVVLDEFDGVSRARAQTTLGQGLLTEAVDRRDRRLVEAGQGPPDPRTAPLANPWRPGVEHDEPLVTGRQRGAFEVLSGDLQLGPDAVAKFGGCSSGVRDDEDLVDVDAFGRDRGGRGRQRRTE